jgi:arylsulfatase
MFATLASLAAAKVPNDRPIDSLDQSPFFLGSTPKSAREGFPIWGSDILLAVKWRNWKLHFYRQDSMFDPPAKLGIPYIINLYTDPREEKPTVDSWVVTPMLQIVGAFQASIKSHPVIPMGTPDPFIPGKTRQ